MKSIYKYIYRFHLAWDDKTESQFFSGQPTLRRTSAKKMHAGNRTNEHCYAFSLLAAKNGKDEKKIDIFLRMEADYPK